MADLTYIEKASIESFLGMKTGYVMDFSDKTFQEFVGEATGLDISSEKYNYASNSKANRLRAFIKLESNYVLGRLISAFCDYWLAKARTGETDYRNDEKLFEECVKIAERFKQESIVEHIGALQPNSNDKEFALLAKAIKDSIEKNEPETALDRLHTFVVKYARQLCVNHQIVYNKEESLNSIFGKYIKFLITSNLLLTRE